MFSYNFGDDRIDVINCSDLNNYSKHILSAEEIGECQSEDGRVSVKICVCCGRDIRIDNEQMRLKYSLRADDDDYRPFGLDALLIGAEGEMADCGSVARRFSTLDEALSTMLMLAHETVLPCTVKDVMA